MQPGDRRVEPVPGANKPLYRIIECVGTHNGLALTIDWPDRFSSPEAAESHLAYVAQLELLRDNIELDRRDQT